MITTTAVPLIEISDRGPGGAEAENVTVFPVGDHCGMIFSEGLLNQHLAYDESKDLEYWDIFDEIRLEVQR